MDELTKLKIELASTRQELEELKELVVKDFDFHRCDCGRVVCDPEMVYSEFADAYFCSDKCAKRAENDIEDWEQTLRTLDR